ncbi:hypothetical protein GF380_01655, partial [Candidatus Uhrbacteria bacterium]|nr:hypothetical protein [Candidatus Uhrbacteria bacterium]
LTTFGETGTGNGQFDGPTGIAVFGDSIYVVDTGNDRVQVFSLSSVVTNPYGDNALDAQTTPSLPLSGRYTNPGRNQANVILPHVYGDMTENSDGGAWVCPEIDSVNHVFCVAAWPVLSVANGNTVSVYVDGALQSSGYTFDENNNYESQGAVAIVTFSSDPGGTVTVQCQGKETSPGSGTVITNPVDVIEDWLDYVADLLDAGNWEKDVNNFAQARNTCVINGYRAAGVFQANNSLGAYLQTILNSFLGTFRFSNSGKVQLHFKSLTTEQATLEEIEEAQAIDLKVKKDINTVLNRIIINYAISYTEIDRRFKNGGDPSYFRTAENDTADAVNSLRQYGERTLTLNFDWNRHTDSITTILAALLDTYNDAEFVVEYEGQDFKFLPLELGDQVTATLSLVRDTDNVVQDDVVYEIREKSVNLDNFTTQMTLYSLNFIDVTRQVSGAVYIGDTPVYIGFPVAIA